MDSNTTPSRYAFLAEEYRRAAKASDEQYFEEAWHHLERPTWLPKIAWDRTASRIGVCWSLRGGRVIGTNLSVRYSGFSLPP